MNTFKLIGAGGLLLISIGLLYKNRTYQDTLYIVGGILLELYSIHIHDIIFIILQIVFIVSAIYDFIQAVNNIP